MTEEKGNTIQVSGRWGDGILGIIAEAFDDVRERFEHCEGKFKVTIEFYPDSEVEDA